MKIKNVIKNGENVKEITFFYTFKTKFSTLSFKTTENIFNMHKNFSNVQIFSMPINPLEFETRSLTKAKIDS